jgi:hypothetical protein
METLVTLLLFVLQARPAGADQPEQDGADPCLGWEALRLGRPLFLAKSVTEDLSLTWPEEMLHYGAKILSDHTIEELFDRIPFRKG